MHVLAGDLGGTNLRLALFESEGSRLSLLFERAYASRDLTSLEQAVGRFLDESLWRPERACIGVAGPVFDGRSQVTNLAWTVDAAALAQRFRLRSASLLNDLEALAHAIPALEARDLAAVAAGEPEQEGNVALIAAGTGLGEAGILRRRGLWQPFATEGGHASFAPETEVEIELLRFLRRRHGRVSQEHVVSGPGLAAIFEFFLARHGEAPPEWFLETRGNGDSAAAVAGAAAETRSREAMAAVDLFLRLYGAEAGNLALKIMATGGVFIGGGIAPKLLARLRGSDFLEAFRAKAPMRPLLERIPVQVIVQRNAALLGAARYAAAERG